MSTLVGRVALVTGASRGIGAATAVALARAGAAVAVTARTLDDDPDARLSGSLQRTVRAIEAVGGVGIPIVADLTDPESRAAIVPAVAGGLGPVDVLVNNAAAAIYAEPSEMPLRRRRLLFEVNVHAPVDLAQAVIPAMKAARRGSIVNVTSATSAPEPGPPYHSRALGTTPVPYGASKAALERFTAGLAAELFGFDIAVNAIGPVAAVRTEGADVFVGAGMLPDDAFEPVDHLARAITHLAACTAADTTGEILTSRALLLRIGALDEPR